VVMVQSTVQSVAESEARPWKAEAGNPEEVKP
jgi:hypothetical protein